MKIFAYLAAMIAAVAWVAPAAADEAAETFVQSILDEAEPHLAAPTQKERFDGIADLVDKYVDMRRVSRFVLGQYARKITEEQKAVYDPLFEKYATQVYQNVLSEYAGERLRVIIQRDNVMRGIEIEVGRAD